jgi:asparagine synthase (glutamine-hydrolysing)
MWGFAIWDNDKKELFAARDRIGIKPFYYTFQNGRFVFGSEIKSLLQHPAITKAVNFEELPNYLNYGMSGKSSLFSGIQKLSAGHTLLLSSNGNIKLNEYWSPIKSQTEYTKMSEKEIHSEVLRLLKQSIKDRMMSDVPFGVFLSGGIDSSLNVALMAELMDRPVDTFTVGFKELEKYNELEYAKQIADLYKTNHHEILIDDKDSFDILEKLAWHEDEPNADPVCIPLYYLSKLTRDSGTVVVQVGEGSDEQFCGYKWMLRDYHFYNSHWKFYSGLPSFIKNASYSVLKPVLKATNLQIIQEYFRRATKNEQFYWSGSSVFSPSYQEDLFLKKYSKLLENPSLLADDYHKKLLSIKPDADYLQRVQYIELKQRLAELLLMRVDKIGMAHSIEARVPFLDHRLVEFTMTIPANIKVPDKITTKSVLKKAVEPILPKNIIYRKKQGFAAPVKEWLRNEWYDYTESKIIESYFVKQGIFDKSNIQQILSVHKSGKRNLSTQIFSLLMLSLWHEKFFE